MIRHHLSAVVVALVLLGVRTAPCAAREVYVDNQAGSDAFDGRSAVPVSTITGPVRSLARAQQVAEPGDVVVLANTGVPYYGSLQLAGGRHSGSRFVPFTVEGNGAVLDGSRPVPPGAWREVERHLWRMSPWRKGHYRLLLEGAPVPEHPVPDGAAALPEIPEGHWSVWKGSIYYRGRPGVDVPPEMPFWFAVDGVGLTLYNVRHVHVRNLTLQNFRLDGVNAHNLCRDVVLENVRATGNGRAGVAVGGTSQVFVLESELAANGRHSLLVTGRGTAEVEETFLDQPATVE